MSELKLYVWTNIFCDYTCGMAVVLAANKEEAYEELLKKRKQEVMNPDTYDMEKLLYDLDNVEPDIYDTRLPMADYVWGGG